MGNSVLARPVARVVQRRSTRRSCSRANAPCHSRSDGAPSHVPALVYRRLKRLHPVEEQHRDPICAHRSPIRPSRCQAACPARARAGPGARIVRAVGAFPGHSGRAAFPGPGCARRTGPAPVLAAAPAYARRRRGRRPGDAVRARRRDARVPVDGAGPERDGGARDHGHGDGGPDADGDAGHDRGSAGLSPRHWFSNATTTVQWIRVDSGTDSDISSATGRTYTLVDDDLGKQIKVKVDFADAHRMLSRAPAPPSRRAGRWARPTRPRHG